MSGPRGSQIIGAVQRIAKSVCLLAVAHVIASTAAGSASAQDLGVPEILTHQGRLFDRDDRPVDGELEFVFSIYDDPENGNLLWTEAQTITLDNGYFSTTLGETEPLAGVFDGRTLFIAVSIDGDEEMTPREELGTVPYAFLAANVVGDITPTTVSVGDQMVINDEGEWVGPTTGLVGPQGEAGPRGEAGETGPQGPAGATGAEGPAGPRGVGGPQGPQGSAGPQGAPGQDGVIGPQGPQGVPGAVAAQGATGPTGAAGSTGPTGPTGAAGVAGPQGAAGPSGLDGAQGPQGAPGADGAQGAVGPQGAPGVDGAQGLQGVPGADGPPGADGAQGPRGAPGVDGLPGTVGPQGSPGADGAQGPQGAPGTDGAVGAQGPQGAPGADGAVGAQGPQGAPGADGLPGTVGPQGAPGADGAAGSQGPQGAPGAAGSQGPQGAPGADGAVGSQGPQGAPGADGLPGTVGPQGAPGLDGVDGIDGLDGAEGPQGAPGLQGSPGLDGMDGMDGLDGLDGPTGPQGPPGSGSVFSYVSREYGTFRWGFTLCSPNPCPTGIWTSNTPASALLGAQFHRIENGVQCDIADGDAVRVEASAALRKIQLTTADAYYGICAINSSGVVSAYPLFSTLAGAEGATTAVNRSLTQGFSVGTGGLAPGRWIFTLCGDAGSNVYHFGVLRSYIGVEVFTKSSSTSCSPAAQVLTPSQTPVIIL